jgi:hypothetical protein
MSTMGWVFEALIYKVSSFSAIKQAFLPSLKLIASFSGHGITPCKLFFLRHLACMQDFLPTLSFHGSFFCHHLASM